MDPTTVLAVVSYRHPMWRLVKYLEENQQSLIDSVDTERKTTHMELAEKLAELRIGEPRDNALLANAVIEALWLGKRAQQIKEAGDKSAEQFFREVVMIAFETGRRSAITAP